MAHDSTKAAAAAHPQTGPAADEALRPRRTQQLRQPNTRVMSGEWGSPSKRLFA